jgi:hypothetical protein
MQVQPQFNRFRLGFSLAVRSLLNVTFIHKADSVAAGVAACLLMSSLAMALQGA